MGILFEARPWLSMNFGGLSDIWPALIHRITFLMDPKFLIFMLIMLSV
jgi:hypothetical protein